ncbi:MAG: hypothetical protein GXY20_13030 [Clostridiales bacterium]|nr:hypothetical protein [Clostridiales bacterium]
MKKIANTITEKVRSVTGRAEALLRDNCGDLAVNTIGSIILAVVIVGLLILAVNSFFPGFFQSIFDGMEQKLNANW